MQIKDVGEFGLIDRLRKIVKSESKNLFLGIGDDAAVVGSAKRKYTLVTTDSFVEQVHFNRAWATWNDIGYKAMMANVSDIAAMGGIPEWAVISLNLPDKTNVKDVEDLYRGIGLASTNNGVHIVGGNVSKASVTSLHITLLGSADKVIPRSGAKIGDVIAVTGTLGLAHAGLRIFQKKLTSSRNNLGRTKFLRPEARIKWINVLIRNKIKVNACIDLSDGLASDLGHVCKASGVGAVIDLSAIPVAVATQKVATMAHENVMDYVLFGGEDYELLLSMSKKEFIKAKIVLKQNIHAIGFATRDKTLKVFDGEFRTLTPKGYKHF